MDFESRGQVAGRTALHMAAAEGHAAAATALLRLSSAGQTAGRELAARDRYGWTPLHLAAKRGRREVFASLLAEPDAAAAVPCVEPALLADCLGIRDLVYVGLLRFPLFPPRPPLASSQVLGE